MRTINRTRLDSSANRVPSIRTVGAEVPAAPFLRFATSLFGSEGPLAGHTLRGITQRGAEITFDVAGAWRPELAATIKETIDDATRGDPVIDGWTVRVTDQSTDELPQGGPARAPASLDWNLLNSTANRVPFVRTTGAEVPAAPFLTLATALFGSLGPLAHNALRGIAQRGKEITFDVAGAWRPELAAKIKKTIDDATRGDPVVDGWVVRVTDESNEESLRLPTDAFVRR